MAKNYSQVSYGSQGGDVKTLQEMLNSNGYELDVDGVFGSKTQAAVKDYQKLNNLKVDGIAGKETWGMLTKAPAGGTASTGSTSQAGAAVSGNPQAAAPAEKSSAAGMQFSYDDYQESETVQQAYALLQQQMASKPGAYESQWQEQINGLMNQIMNREDFSYDLNADALYKQYANQYMQQGKMAMMDTMGQAQAMTGGYGNSYAQAVGQQAYQGYLQQLNEVVPELYQMAYDRYQQEVQDLYNQFSMLGAQEEQAYGRYRDQMSDYYANLQQAFNQYNTEREYDYSKYAADRNFAYGAFADDRSYAYQTERDAVADKQWSDSFAYQKEQDAIANQQWQDSFDYEKYRDTVADQQWEDSFQYQKDRDAVSDSQWEQSFQYQKDRDTVADKQWAQEFAEAQRQYNESQKASSGSGSSSGSAKQYEMSASEYEKWNNMWTGVANKSEAKMLRDNMISAGVPEEIAFVFYEHFLGEDDEQVDTTVAPTKKPVSAGSSGISGAASRHTYKNFSEY